MQRDTKDTFNVVSITNIISSSFLTISLLPTILLLLVKNKRKQKGLLSWSVAMWLGAGFIQTVRSEFSRYTNRDLDRCGREILPEGYSDIDLSLYQLGSDLSGYAPWALIPAALIHSCTYKTKAFKYVGALLYGSLALMGIAGSWIQYAAIANS